MFKLKLVTDGGVTYCVTATPAGGFQISAESASYGPHDSFLTLNSDGGNPTVTIQKGADAHVLVVEAGGAGGVLFDSAA